MSNTGDTPLEGAAGKSPGAIRRFLGDLNKATRGWLIRLLVPLVIFALAFVFIWPLKQVLGIYTIESYLRQIQEGLAFSEDTIFSYKYDLAAPDVSAERQLIEERLTEETGLDVTSTEFFTASFSELQQYREFFEADEWLQLLRAKNRLRSARTRVFYFSASAGSEVTVDYELICYQPNEAPYPDPIPFTVKVNKHPIRSSEDDRGRERGRESLDAAVLDDFDTVVPTASPEYDMRKHTLTLTLFDAAAVEAHRAGRATDPLVPIVRGDIERCTFDAMIFVRDLPQKFVRQDGLTWLRDRIP